MLTSTGTLFSTALGVAKTIFSRKDARSSKTLISAASNETLVADFTSSNGHSSPSVSTCSSRLSQASTVADRRASWNQDDRYPKNISLNALPAVADDKAAAGFDDFGGKFDFKLINIEIAAAARGQDDKKVASRPKLGRKFLAALAAIREDQRALAKTVYLVAGAYMYRKELLGDHVRAKYVALADTDLEVLFANLVDIGALANELADRVEAIENGTAPETVSAMLADMLPRSRNAYAKYASQRAAAQAAYGRVREAHPGLFACGDGYCRTHFSNWDLHNVLHEPVRRVPQFQRLLKNLVCAISPPSSTSSAAVETRVQLMSARSETKALYDDVLVTLERGRCGTIAA